MLPPTFRRHLGRHPQDHGPFHAPPGGQFDNRLEQLHGAHRICRSAAFPIYQPPGRTCLQHHSPNTRTQVEGSACQAVSSAPSPQQHQSQCGANMYASAISTANWHRLRTPTGPNSTDYLLWTLIDRWVRASSSPVSTVARTPWLPCRTFQASQPSASSPGLQVGQSSGSRIRRRAVRRRDRPCTPAPRPPDRLPNPK